MAIPLWQCSVLYQGKNDRRKATAAWISSNRHLRDDVDIEEPGQPLGHALSSSENEIGLSPQRSGGWQLDAVLGIEKPLEGLRRLRTAPDIHALLVNQTADEFLHRDADLPCFALEPGLVPGIDIADGDGWRSSQRLLVGQPPICATDRYQQHMPSVAVAGRRRTGKGKDARRCGRSDACRQHRPDIGLFGAVQDLDGRRQVLQRDVEIDLSCRRSRQGVGRRQPHRASSHSNAASVSPGTA